MSKVLKGLALPMVLGLLWWAATSAGLWSPYVLPGPQRVWRAFTVMVGRGELALHVMMSLRRVLVGFSISFSLAFFLGALAGWSRGTEYYGPLLEFFRHVPPLSMIPLLILWSGIGETTKIVIIVLASFFPMFLNVKKGIAGCDPGLLEVGRSLRFSQWKLFSRIALPNALPDVLTGMRVGLGYSWRAIVSAEMIAAASGLGYLILDSQQMSRSDKVMVGIVVIGTVGFACDRIFAVLIRRLIPGGVDDSWS